MARNPAMRMSDADRERVVDVLRDHMADGRLSLDEFQERVDAAYQARTFADADVLLQDLPIDLATLSLSGGAAAPPEASKAAAVAGVVAGPGVFEAAMRRRRQAVFRTWTAMSALLIGIWVLTCVGTGHLHYFWPVWPVGITGLLLTARLVAAGNEPTDRQRERWERHQMKWERRRARHEARMERHRQRARWD